MSKAENFQEMQDAAQKACSKEELLFLANTAEDLRNDMAITEKEYRALISVLQNKIEV